MHKDLDEVIEDNVNCDICIVGSGPAGLSLFSEFQNDNIKIIILESGKINPSSYHQNLNEGYSIGPRSLNLVSSRLRCFGGAGKLWAGVCRPMDNYDFEKNHFQYSGWPINYQNIVKYYKKASELFNLNYEIFSSEKYQKQTKLGSRFNEFTRKGALINGVTYQRVNTFDRDLTNKFQEKLFLSSNFHLITNATVTNMMQMKKGKISHLVATSQSGRTIEVSAKRFILCAGAIENARILLYSNLYKEVKNNPYIGSCFMSHPAFKEAGTLITDKDNPKCEYHEDDLRGDFGFEVNPVERKKNKILRHNIHLSEARNFEFTQKKENASSVIMKNLHILKNFTDKVSCKFLGGEIGSKYWNLDIAIEQEPRTDNFIKLSDNFDSLGKRKIEVFWDSVNNLEMRTVSEAVKTVGRESVLSGLGICEFSEPHVNKEIFKQDDAINHHIGTTRMAKSKDSGVVDLNLRCFGLDNLFITGSSVFPTSSIVNPTFTIVALSLRLGEYLKNDLQSHGIN